MGHAPNRHWETFTMFSAINMDGRIPTRVFEEATDRWAMETFVQWHLVLERKKDDLVVRNNLGAHKSPSVFSHIQSAGAHAWFLPPYSPDWGPIEPIGSNVRSLLTATAARTRQKLGSAIGKSLNALKRTDIQDSINHSGY